MPLPPKPYEWIAFYNDSTYLYQEDPDTGIVSSSEQIDRSKLSHVVFYGPNCGPLVTQYFDAGMCFFYRRRTENSGSGGVEVCHMLGWFRDVCTCDGIPLRAQHVTYILEPNIAAGRPAAVIFNAGAPRAHRWMYEHSECAADCRPVGTAGRVEHWTEAELQSLVPK